MNCPPPRRALQTCRLKDQRCISALSGRHPLCNTLPFLPQPSFRPPPLPRGYWSSYFYIASPPLNLDKARNLDFSASLTNILISLFPLASAQLCCVSARLTRRLVLKLHQPTTLPRAARDVIVTRSLLFDPLLFCTQTYRIVQPGQHSSPTTPGKHSTGLPR